MGKQKVDDNCSIEGSTSESFELLLKRQSNGDYSNCSSITYEMLGFKASILENMKGYSQYGDDYKREEPRDSELTGLEIDATPVIGNRKKVVGTTELRNSIQEFDMPFDPHDDTSVYIEEIEELELEDDGFAFPTLNDDTKEEQQQHHDSSTLPPPPSPHAEMMQTTTMINGRKPARLSTQSTDVVSVASPFFLVEEWKTISTTNNMNYFLDADKEYGEAAYYQDEVTAADRTDRQSNRTSSTTILPLEPGVFKDGVYGDTMKSSSSSGLGEDDICGQKKSLEETIKDEEESTRSRTLKKKKSNRKLKKDSSSRSSKRLIACSDDGEEAEITSSSRSLKNKKSSSSRKLKKDSSSKKLKKEPSSRKLKKESSSRRNLKKESSSRSSKKLAESEEPGDSSGTVKKESNHRTSKLLKSKSKSNRSSKTSKNKVLSSPSSPGEEDGSSSTSNHKKKKKKKVNLREKLLRKSSSNRRSKNKQKLEDEDEDASPAPRPTLKKKKSSRKNLKKKKERNSGGSSSSKRTRRSSFTETLLLRRDSDSGISVTSRLSNILLRTSFTKDSL